MLSKIHKPGNRGRPIVNSTASITEKISAFVDAHLRQYKPRIPSYVKDTTHFINIMRNIQLDPEDLLVTIAISSLYTNIPHTEGTAATNRMVEEIGTDILLKMFIPNLAHQLLTKNYFSFNGMLYEQIQGTAMGTRMAPNYAIIFMHYLETNFLANYPKQPKIWLRFIDDIFMIWKYGNLELEKFLEALNSHHQKIKFTYTTDQNEIPFLDTIVYRSTSNGIYTRIYHKPTDQKYYLHYHSAHPRNQKNSVPYGLLIRYKRICTEDHYFEQEVRKIYNQLKYRKYPTTLLDEAIEKVRNMDRLSLLRPSTKKLSDNTRLIINYNPRKPYLQQILKKFEGLLLMTRKLVITPEQIKITYSRSPNLKDKLVKSNIDFQPKPNLCQPCWQPRCLTCTHMNTSQVISSKEKHSYPIRGNFNCKSNEIIYVMTSNICNIQYVGETSNSMNCRCRGHESTIRTNKDHPVVIHYRSYSHTIDDYSITIVDKENNKNRRLKLEEAWMTLLNTLTPRGLNGRW